MCWPTCYKHLLSYWNKLKLKALVSCSDCKVLHFKVDLTIIEREGSDADIFPASGPRHVHNPDHIHVYGCFPSDYSSSI